MRLDAPDRRLLGVVQERFPVSRDPYAELGRLCGLEAGECLRRLARLRRRGVIRRLGALLDSRRLGMAVTLVGADVSPRSVGRVAGRLDGLDEVTHSYLRDGRPNLWFTLVAGSRRRIGEILAGLAAEPGVRSLVEAPATRVYKLAVRFGEPGAPASGPGPGPVRNDASLGFTNGKPQNIEYRSRNHEGRGVAASCHFDIRHSIFCGSAVRSWFFGASGKNLRTVPIDPGRGDPTGRPYGQIASGCGIALAGRPVPRFFPEALGLLAWLKEAPFCPVPERHPGEARPGSRAPAARLSPGERDVLAGLARGVPGGRRPWAAVARRLGRTEAEVIETVRGMLARRLVRRVAAVVDGRRLGFRANALVAWRVPLRDLDRAGAAAARRAGVSHVCARRAAPGWPYNLYTMVHARTSRGLREAVGALRADCGTDECRVLPTLREFTKRPPHVARG